MQDPSTQQRASGSSGPFAPAPNGSGAGEGVDRKIEKKTWTPRRLGLLAAVVLFVGLVGYGLYTTTGGQRLNVEREKLTIASVERGPFQDFIAVTGNVMPERTVYLDAVEGGRIEEVFVREGAMVEQGDPILRLSNSDLQLRLMNNEANLAEQEANLQSMRFQVAQNRLNLRQQMTEMDYQIQRLERQHARQAQLHEKNLIADEEYQSTRDELAYWHRRQQLTREAFRQDSLMQETRLSQMEEAVQRMRRNFSVLQETLENLLVRAPVSGQLTALDAEVGEIRSAGSRFGQIDVLEGYKVRAAIDEYYIARVQRGQTASGEVAGNDYTLHVTRVYPEVRDGRFEVDLDFEDEAPEGIRRGQTLRFRLTLGDPSEAILLPRGGFYQTTGGNWVFVVGPEGEKAVKRSIRLGRQNPQYFEVLEGLEPGDRVVVSGYDTFGNADRLVLK